MRALDSLWRRLFLCVICTIVNQLYDAQLQEESWYLHAGTGIIPPPHLIIGVGRCLHSGPTHGPRMAHSWPTHGPLVAHS